MWCFPFHQLHPVFSFVNSCEMSCWAQQIISFLLFHEWTRCAHQLLHLPADERSGDHSPLRKQRGSLMGMWAASRTGGKMKGRLIISGFDSAVEFTRTMPDLTERQNLMLLFSSTHSGFIEVFFLEQKQQFYNLFLLHSNTLRKLRHYETLYWIFRF